MEEMFFGDLRVGLMVLDFKVFRVLSIFYGFGFFFMVLKDCYSSLFIFFFRRELRVF